MKGLPYAAAAVRLRHDFKKTDESKMIARSCGKNVERESWEKDQKARERANFYSGAVERTSVVVVTAIVVARKFR